VAIRHVVSARAAEAPAPDTDLHMNDHRVSLLVDFIGRNLLAESATIDARTRLLSDGLIDSMGVTMLAAFIEEEFDVRFEDSDMRAGQLETIADILAVVDSRR
jgi:acyl carrier protein